MFWRKVFGDVMFEKLSEAFADKSVGDMWSMGFLTTMRVTDII